MPHVAEHIGTSCAGCRQPLAGRYCSHCGEQVLDPEALTVRHFVTHTVADELTHLDGKFWRTLRALILRPGFLSEEYSAGRRRRYVRPVRLLIAAIITYTLATRGGLLVTLTIGWVSLSVAPVMVSSTVDVEEAVRRIDRFGVLARMLAEKKASVDVTSEAVRERFHSRLYQFVQPLSFANVLLLAVSLCGMFHRRRQLLLDHLVFSVHFVSFVLVSSLALMPAVWLFRSSGGLASAIIVTVTLWQFMYLTGAVRRFYLGRAGGARKRLLAIGTAFGIYLLNSAFVTGVQLVGGVLALSGVTS